MSSWGADKNQSVCFTEVPGEVCYVLAEICLPLSNILFWGSKNALHCIPKVNVLEMYGMRQNIQYWNACTFSDGAYLQHMCSQCWKGSCVVQLLLDMFLSMEEKIIIVEYYFHSYGSDHERGLQLQVIITDHWFTEPALQNGVH
jgi:hypothetical protein